MPRKVVSEESSNGVERRVGRVCSNLRLITAEGAFSARTTLIVVGRRGGANDELVDVLVDPTVQVLRLDSTESLIHVLDAVRIEAIIFSADISRLQIAAFVETLKDRPLRPDLFALVAGTLGDAWLSHFGVTPIPKWSNWKSVRDSVLRRSPTK